MSLAQSGIGVLILGLSWAYFYEFTAATGMLLGGAMLAAGGVGWAGGRARSANLTNAHLLACLLALLLSFNFIGQVVREVHVDCGLAQLFMQARSLDGRVAALQADEAMHTVYSRLNEMEDMLSLVQEGTLKRLELKGEQDKLRHVDSQYVAAKLELIRSHAQAAIDGIVSNPNLNETVVRGLSAEDKAFLKARLDAADAALETVRRHHTADGGAITAEEYGSILNALTDGFAFADKTADPELAKAKEELPHMAAALGRQLEDSYHTLLPGSAHRDLERIDSQRARRRTEWERRLTQVLEAQAVSRAGGDAGAALAEHCVRESRGHGITLAAGMAAVLTQLVSAYVALSLGMRLPVKGE